jgi:hypothetical protein
VIEAYLRELASALRLPGRMRARVLAEARDHLLCAAEHDGEDAAVPAFGAPDLLARRFAAELATARGRAATLVTGAVLVALGSCVAIHDGARNRVAFLSGQVAVTCLALSAIRLARHRADTAMPAGKLRLVDRGNAVALAATIVAAVAAHVPATLLVPGTALGAAALAAAVARTRVLDHGDPGEPILEDVVALPGLHRLAEPGRWALRHPWRLAGLVSLAAGGALAAAHGLAEGPPRDLAGGVASCVALIAIEGGAVLASYAALGRFLRLR